MSFCSRMQLNSLPSAQIYMGLPGVLCLWFLLESIILEPPLDWLIYKLIFIRVNDGMFLVLFNILVLQICISEAFQYFLPKSSTHLIWILFIMS